MIKSLFDYDEYDEDEPQPKDNPSETEESIKRQLNELNLSAEAPEPEREEETIILPKLEQAPAAKAATPPVNFIFSENQFFEVKPETRPAEAAAIQPETAPQPQNSNATENHNLFQTETKPLTTAETIRQSGMAWSAAVGLFGSVLFLMILGWFFDLLTGKSPVGLVVGIIFGSALGLYQFFRTTSQIFKK